MPDRHSNTHAKIVNVGNNESHLLATTSGRHDCWTCQREFQKDNRSSDSKADDSNPWRNGGLPTAATSS
jgi:hypothetical protein